MEFCPEVDKKFCNLILATNVHYPGFIDFNLQQQKPNPDIADKSPIEILQDAQKLLDSILAEGGHDRRYVARVRSFVHILRRLGGQQASLHEDLATCLLLPIDECQPYSQAEIQAQQERVEYWIKQTGAGTSMHDNKIEDLAYMLARQQLIDPAQIAPFCRQVIDTHLPLLTALVGDVSPLKFEIETIYDKTLACRCWLSWDGTAFKLQFNRYYYKSFAKHQLTMTSLHEMVHAVQAQMVLDQIENGQRPPSDGVTWATDPSQVPAEGSANAAGLLVDSEVMRSPYMQYSYDSMLYTLMVRNNAQFMLEEGQRLENVEAYLKHHYGSIYCEAYFEGVKRRMRSPTARLNPYLYAPAAQDYYQIARTGTPDQIKKLLQLTFHDTCDFAVLAAAGFHQPRGA